MIIFILSCIILLLALSLAINDRNNREIIKSLNIKINNLKHLIPIKTPTCLDGVFEIHISVDPEDNYVKLLNYARQNQESKGMKVVYAVSSNKNNQYMISYFTRKNDDKIAVENALKIANELEDLNIKVLRVKVEGHGVNGTPMSKEEYDNIKIYLLDKYDNKCGTPYFEFHVKISNRESNTLCYETLENDVNIFESKDKFVAVSHNICSVTKHPLLTMRVYDTGFIEAQEFKDYVMNNLKEKGYIFGDAIQQEFSIYDTYSQLDAGWIGYK